MIYTIENEFIRVSAETLGAQLSSIKLANDDTEYLWQGSDKYWKNRAITLFPICGRLPELKYTYERKEYNLGCHGFARYSEFILESITKTKMVFLLKENEYTLSQYPFKFELRVTFELNKNTLVCTNTVTNPDDAILPFAFGAHPGFNVPLEKGLEFEDYKVYFGIDTLSLMELTDKGLRTGEFTDFKTENGIINLKHSLFDVNSPFFKNRYEYVKLYSLKGKKAVTVKSDQANFYGLWHTDASDAPFLCIEPWEGCPSKVTGMTDLKDKDYMQHLSKNESYSFKYEITVE